MPALAETDTAIWRLAGATKYKRNHLGSFAPSTPMSSHMFGWNKVKKAFIIEDTFGMAGTTTRTLPLLPELAELFLVRCLEPAFAERFLNSYCPRRDENEVLTLEGNELHLSCSAYKSGRVGRDDTLPTLSLSSGRGTDSLWLFYELRQSFGQRMKKLLPKEIRSNLQPQ